MCARRTVCLTPQSSQQMLCKGSIVHSSRACIILAFVFFPPVQLLILLYLRIIGFGRVCVFPTLCQPWAVPGRQIVFCTPCVRYHDRERELYSRSTSDDLFISELWRLLDDYEVFKPQIFSHIHWPGVKKAGQDKANKVLNHVNKEQKSHQLHFFPLVCYDY